MKLKDLEFKYPVPGTHLPFESFRLLRSKPGEYPKREIVCTYGKDGLIRIVQAVTNAINGKESEYDIHPSVRSLLIDLFELPQVVKVQHVIQNPDNL